MKKLVIAAGAARRSRYSAAAAYACDGMKGHEKSETTQSQAKKQDKKPEQDRSKGASRGARPRLASS